MDAGCEGWQAEHLSWTVYKDTQIYGGDKVDVTSLTECKDRCARYTMRNCKGVDYDGGNCWLLNKASGRQRQVGVTHYGLKRTCGTDADSVFIT